MANIYLAHNYEAKDWLVENVVPILKVNGHNVVSGWIYGLNNHNQGPEMEAATDLIDIDRAGVLIHFTQQFGSKPGRGKFVELGYAVRAGIRVIIIGEEMGCVFYHLPTIRRVKDIEEALKYL